MQRARKITIILVVAVAFCFGLASLAQAPKVPKKAKILGEPIWGITQDGTDISVNWVDHAPNPRFAIYDPGTPGDETDDVVLDKETGLVWERSPSTSLKTWFDAIEDGHSLYLGGRMGWRLPTIEELASLADPSEGPPKLPNGHPFINIASDFPDDWYWSATNYGNISNIWCVNFYHDPTISAGTYLSENPAWYVRGGQGHDGYGW